MFRRYIIAASVILLLFVFAYAEEESTPYDIYLPQPYEIPNPINIFSPRYLYLEAGLSSASELTLYADYLQKNMDANAFYTLGTSKNRFGYISLNGSMSRGLLEFKTNDIIKTAQQDSLLTNIQLINSLIFRNKSILLEYSNTIYAMTGLYNNMDLFHGITFGLQGDGFSLSVSSIIIDPSDPIDNVIRVTADLPNMSTGICYYRIPYPAVTFISQHFSVNAGVQRSSPYVEISPFSNAFFRENKVSAYMYISDISAAFDAFAANVHLYTDIDSVDTYTDILKQNIMIKTSLVYTKRISDFYIQTGPLWEYSEYYIGPMLDMTMAFNTGNTQYVAQYRLYYDSDISNMLNIMFSTGTDHFRFICGLKNVFSVINPYYQHYAPTRTYFINLAIIDGKPIY